VPVSLMFLSLTDSVGTVAKGGSLDGDYADQIEIDDVKWSLEEGSVGLPGAKGASKRIIPGTMEFSKQLSYSTARLLKIVASGEICREARFTLTERSELEPFHLEIVLKEVRILSYELTAADQDQTVALDESWTLTYKSIKFGYEGAFVELTRPPGADEALDNEADRPTAKQLEADFKKLPPAEQRAFLGSVQSGQGHGNKK
jgi:type VI protein secretion system component Hcp